MSHNAIATARARSEATLTEMRRLLEPCSDDPVILTIAVSGSLGRLEQTARSDADVIVVLKDTVHDSTGIVQSVWHMLEPLGLPSPKSGGIFSVTTTQQQLVDSSSLGIIAEDMAVFGQRMQLLLDSRPVISPVAFRQLQRGILDRFAEHVIDERSTRNNFWRALLDDVLRYHRSLCVRYRHAKRRQLPDWPELQLKAGFSRLVNIVGLLFLLAESTTKTNQTEWVAENLSKTPLERIADCYAKYDDSNANVIQQPYGEFLTKLDDVAFYKMLDATAAGHSTAATVEQLRELHVAAMEMKSALLQFLLARVNNRDWPQQFLEDLIL